MISHKGILFIQSWESLFLKAYKDQAGIWTIGYGTIKYPNGNRVKEGDVITKNSATDYMLIELSGICNKLSDWITPKLEVHEFDALVSMSYNIGTQGFRTSTLLRKLNLGAPILENYFTRWNKITKDGKLIPSAGLTRRRKSEFKLFTEADYTGNS